MTKKKKTFHRIILDGIVDENTKSAFAGLPRFSLTPLLKAGVEVPVSVPLTPPFPAMWCEWEYKEGVFSGVWLVRETIDDDKVSLNIHIQHYFSGADGKPSLLPIATSFELASDGTYNAFDDRMMSSKGQTKLEKERGCKVPKVDPDIFDETIDLIDEYLNRELKDAYDAPRLVHVYAKKQLSGEKQLCGFLYEMVLREHIILKFALALMNVKNIEIVEPESPSVSRRGKRNRHKKDHFHTLRIRPGSQRSTRLGDTQPSGVKNSLHIARGHFKTYTADAPLFGQHVGTYWWEAQVRGSKAAGTITKDYEVYPPKEEEE